MTNPRAEFDLRRNGSSSITETFASQRETAVPAETVVYGDRSSGALFDYVPSGRLLYQLRAFLHFYSHFPFLLLGVVDTGSILIEFGIASPS